MIDTTHRVEAVTSPRINDRIANRAVRRVAACAQGDRADIDRRMHSLDREWDVAACGPPPESATNVEPCAYSATTTSDIERLLQTNFAAISLLAVLLGRRDRRSLMLAMLVPIFMAQHSLQGWCPPLPLFRKMGFRTRREIYDERFALQALRGDFDVPADSGNAYRIMDAVRH